MISPAGVVPAALVVEVEVLAVAALVEVVQLVAAALAAEVAHVVETVFVVVVVEVVLVAGLKVQTGLPAQALSHSVPDSDPHPEIRQEKR